MTTTEDPSAAAVSGLTSWRDGPAKQAIVTFVARVCGEDGSEPVPVEDRLAVFDNDGTLWCEKPMPIQLDFILRRLAAKRRPTTSCATCRIRRSVAGTWNAPTRRWSSCSAIWPRTG